MISQKINVIGAGSWGTTLANYLAKNGYEVILYTHNQEIIDSINSKNINHVYFKNNWLDRRLIANHIENFKETDYTLNAVPTQFIREFYTSNNIKIKNNLINSSKGIERGTKKLIHQIFFDLGVEDQKFCLLTGPSHAEEVFKNKPTVVVSASANEKLSHVVQDIFSSQYFRVYTSSDVIGAEIGGALKNVIALAAGICYGLDMGDNLISALLTRGLAEIMRLGSKLGAENLTLAGLSGLGDLFATCSSQHSRNRLTGKLIAQGKSVIEIENEYNFVAEGIYTSNSALELAKRLGEDMPIVEQINLIISEGKNPLKAVNDLMVREFRPEFDSYLK